MNRFLTRHLLKTTLILNNQLLLVMNEIAHENSFYFTEPSKKELRFSRDATFHTIHSGGSSRYSTRTGERAPSGLSIQGVGMTRDEEEDGVGKSLSFVSLNL